MLIPCLRSDHGNDVIMWMDHRALDEAQTITETRDAVLEQVGGVCSPEFSLAKLVWLRNKQPQRFANAKAFLELPDYLTWRCLESDEFALLNFRPSNCSLTCKWGFDGEKSKWPQDFYERVGLRELMTNTDRIGSAR